MVEYGEIAPKDDSQGVIFGSLVSGARQSGVVSGETEVDGGFGEEFGTDNHDVWLVTVELEKV